MQIYKILMMNIKIFPTIIHCIALQVNTQCFAPVHIMAWKQSTASLFHEQSAHTADCWNVFDNKTKNSRPYWE